MLCEHGVQYLCKSLFSIPSRVGAEVGSLDQVGTLCEFLKNHQTVLRAAAPFYTPPNRAQGTCF